MRLAEALMIKAERGLKGKVPSSEFLSRQRSTSGTIIALVSEDSNTLEASAKAAVQLSVMRNVPDGCTG
jgi:hypothetical protein